MRLIVVDRAQAVLWGLEQGEEETQRSRLNDRPDGLRVKFSDCTSVVRECMKRLVVIQLGGRAVRNAMDKLCTANESAVYKMYRGRIKRKTFDTVREACLAFGEEQ